MAKTAKTPMSVYNLNLFPDKDVPQDREEGEDCGKGGLSVDDEKRHMIHLEAVGEIPHALAVVVRMCDDDDFVSAVYELAGELVDVGFDASWLREEEVADHGDVVPSTCHGGLCFWGRTRHPENCIKG